MKTKFVSESLEEYLNKSKLNEEEERFVRGFNRDYANKFIKSFPEKKTELTVPKTIEFKSAPVPSLPKITNKYLEKAKEKYNQAYKGKSKTPKGIHKLEPRDYDLVIRPMHPGDYIFLFDGDILETERDRNMLKAYYHHNTDTDYFDARPITFGNWRELDYKHQIASYRDEKIYSYEERRYPAYNPRY